MTDLDERLIRAIQQADAPTLEPRALGEPDSDVSEPDDDADSGHEGPPPAPLHGGAQTGPKGVMADYRHAQRTEWARKEAQHAEFMAKLDRQALRGPSQAAEADTELDLGADDELIERYRNMRLAELKAGAKRPSFGNFRQVSPDQFLREVDNEHPRVTVVVHLFESFIPECTRLNRHLTTLASIYEYAKFVRLPASSADLDPLVLPMIQVYRAGKLELNLARVTDDMEELARHENFGFDECESILIGHGVLREEDRGATRAVPSSHLGGSSTSHTLRNDASDDNDDDD